LTRILNLTYLGFWLTTQAQFPETLPTTRVFKRGGVYETGHAAAVC
jgi:hypothetical protein